MNKNLLLFFILSSVFNAFAQKDTIIQITYDTVNVDSTYFTVKMIKYQINDTINKSFLYTVYKTENNKKICEFTKNSNEKLNGYYIEYFETGKIKSITNYDNNLKNGQYIFYYSNGNIKIIGNYYNGVMICDTVRIMENNTGEIIIRKDCKNNSIKSGIWLYYDIYGKIEKTEFW